MGDSVSWGGCLVGGAGVLSLCSRVRMGLSGCGFALECVKCLLDIQYNLASGNKGLQLKREVSGTLVFM